MYDHVWSIFTANPDRGVDNNCRNPYSMANKIIAERNDQNKQQLDLSNISSITSIPSNADEMRSFIDDFTYWKSTNSNEIIKNNRYSNNKQFQRRTQERLKIFKKRSIKIYRRTYLMQRKKKKPKKLIKISKGLKIR